MRTLKTESGKTFRISECIRGTLMNRVLDSKVLYEVIDVYQCKRVLSKVGIKNHIKYN